MYPVLLSYRVLLMCSECERVHYGIIDIHESFTEPSQRHCVDYVDLLDIASENDFLVDDNGKMICFNCVEKKHIEASLPTIAEHNPSLCRR